MTTTLDLDAVSDGRTARVVHRDDSFRLLVVDLPPGGSLAEHAAAEPVTIHCLAGSATLDVGPTAVELEPGRLVVLDAARRHAVRSAGGVRLLVTAAAERSRTVPPCSSASSDRSRSVGAATS